MLTVRRVICPGCKLTIIAESEPCMVLGEPVDYIHAQCWRCGCPPDGSIIIPLRLVEEAKGMRLYDPILYGGDPFEAAESEHYVCGCLRSRGCDCPGYDE